MRGADNERAADSISPTARIRAVGARATHARIRVIDALSKAASALSHRDIERASGEHPLDRVTLYRVLEWLVRQGIAHKTVDAARISRFSLTEASPKHDRHAHFQCDHCGQIYCLNDVRIGSPQLPAGFHFRDAELSIHGECSACASRILQDTASAGSASAMQSTRGEKGVL